MELTYLFEKSILWPFKFKMSADDERMIEMMTKLWSNFAKYGYVFAFSLNDQKKIHHNHKAL